MSLTHGGHLNRKDLRIHFDIDNPKSYKGEPTTNLAKTSAGAKDWTHGNLTATISLSTVTANERYQITNTGSAAGTFRLRFNLNNLTNGQTYTLSFKYKFISGNQEFYLTDWNDTTISTTTTRIREGVYYHTGTGSRSSYDSTYRFMDGFIGKDTVVEIFDIQLEERAYATPYTTYQRTTSQNVVDLAKVSTSITANSLVYASDGSFSLSDNSNSYIHFTNGHDELFPSQTYTLICVAKRNGTASTNHGHGIVFGLPGYNNGIMWTDSHKIACGQWCRNADDTAWQNNSYTPTATYDDDTWVHIAMVFNKSDKIRQFINGTEVGSGTDVSSFEGRDWYGWSGGGDSSSSVRIGGNNTTWQFNGSVSQALGYDRPLSAAEIKDHYDSVKNRYGI